MRGGGIRFALPAAISITLFPNSRILFSRLPSPSIDDLVIGYPFIAGRREIVRAKQRRSARGSVNAKHSLGCMD